MKKMTAEVLEKAHKEIRQAIIDNGTYAPQTCAMVLRNMADDYGIKYANQVLKEFELTRIYNIQPITTRDGRRVRP